MDNNYSLIFSQLEKVSTIFSIVSFWFGTKQRLVAWPISILISLINMPYYFYKGIYVSVFHNLIYIVISLYGWYTWAYGGKKGKALKEITRISWKECIAFGVSMVLYIALLYPILQYIGARLTFLDIVRNSLTLLGLWATSQKKLETYLIWFTVNVLSVFLFYKTKSYWFMGKYIFYLGLSAYSFYEWYRQYASGKEASSA